MVHDEGTSPVAREERRVSARVVALLVLAALMIALGIANSQEVEVEYLLGDAEVALVWVILVSVVLGAILERLYSFVVARRRRRG